MEDDELELMTANLLKIKREITERNEKEADLDLINEENPEGETDRLLHNQSQNPEIVDQIQQRYNEFLLSNPLPSNHEHKLEELLNGAELTLGSAVALFEMLFYFREAISEEVLVEIS